MFDESDSNLDQDSVDELLDIVIDENAFFFSCEKCDFKTEHQAEL